MTQRQGGQTMLVSDDGWFHFLFFCLAGVHTRIALLLVVELCS